jgi:predicted HTH domain antitoxin
MPTITFDFPAEVFSALRKSPDEFAREMRLAAAVEWYAEGIVSQGKAAGIAGLSRAEFLDELARRRVSASQATLDELRDEIRRG